MRLLSWFLTVKVVLAANREYYIKVEPVFWDYAPYIQVDMMGKLIHVNDTVRDRTLYKEYTDSSWSTPVNQPDSHGDLGPVIRASVNDTITIYMWNGSNRIASLHPHGVRYSIDIDGMTSGVKPGENATFTWEVPSRSGPQNGDLYKLWAYHSHTGEGDVYKGLIGPIVVYANESVEIETKATKDEVFMKSIIDVYENPGIEEDTNVDQFFAINGYIYGNLPDVQVSMKKIMIWHLMSFGDEDGIHSMHWHGNVVQRGKGDVVDIVDLFPASFETVVMNADSPGRWMFHCHVVEHFENGMYIYYNVSA